MNILIRCDSSKDIGSGHLMRCLSLGEKLKKNSHTVNFVCRKLSGSMVGLIESQGYNFAEIEYSDFNQLEDANKTIDKIKEIYSEKLDWIIVDHYDLDIKWESLVSKFSKKIMVIDDLANRNHACNLLLDQNFYINLTERYKNLVPKSCITLLGPNHVLLRDEFYNLAKLNKIRDGHISNILIFFGAGDSLNLTSTVLKALKSIQIAKININVVLGEINPYIDEVKKLSDQFKNINIYSQVKNMAQLIYEADLCIGAGGSSMWERCYLGLPTITVNFAENQEQTSLDTATKGAIHYLGLSSDLVDKDYIEAINLMLSNPLIVKRISENARKIYKPPSVSILDLLELTSK
jgi:UDP-2,4-diacetamido-2,4,6-trideoxy-beta-L-altropyranose hydrolase